MGLDTENDYHSLEALPSKKDIENKEGSREVLIPCHESFPDFPFILSSDLPIIELISRSFYHRA